MARRTDCRGFSLLEVLVAFSILALSMGVLMQIFAGGLRSAGLAADYSHAALLAQSELARLRGEGLDPPGVYAAELDGQFRRETTIEPYERGEGGASGLQRIGRNRLFQVTVEVIWGEGPRRRSVPLTTVVLDRRPGP
jgi:general secretion pathway protein I